jgi:hypothetical protein
MKDKEMANIDYIEGQYTIAAGATPPPFTFWWPGGGKAKEYFDVSIAPLKPAKLRETKREWVFLVDDKTGQERWELWVTLHNEESFPVDFIANHVRIN